MSEEALTVVPIKELDAYPPQNWCVEARFLSASKVRTGNVANGLLVDKDGGVIQFKMFKDAIDIVFSKCEVGKVFRIRYGSFKQKDPKWNKTNHTYEWTFSKDTVVESIADDGSIPDAEPVDITTIMNLTTPGLETVHLLGVIVSVDSEPVNFVSAKGNQLTKRSIEILDQTAKVSITLWGDHATSVSTENVGNVLLAKNCSVKLYQQQLQIGASWNKEDIVLNPTTEGAKDMLKWYGEQDQDSLSSAFSLTEKRTPKPSTCYDPACPRKTLAELPQQEKPYDFPEYVHVKASILSVQQDSSKSPFYLECNAKGCRAMLEESDDGNFKCNKCNETYTSGTPKYKLSVHCEDSTGSRWLQAWDEWSQFIIGKPAEYMRDLLVQDANSEYNQLLEDTIGKEYLFMVNAKQRNENVYLTIVKVELADPAAELELVNKQ